MPLATALSLLLATAEPVDWPDTDPRWFLAARFDAGAIAKVIGQAGYGQPFWMWAGLQTSAVTSLEFFAATVGIRLSLPIVEFTAEYRRTESYLRGALPTESVYRQHMLEHSGREGYDALDLDLWGVIPTPYSFIFAELTATRMSTDAPRYDELLRAVVVGWCGSARIGVGARFGDGGWIRLGVLTETVISERQVEPFVRVGPSLQLVFGPHADLVVALLAPVANPDDVSLMDSMTGAVALRWRIATGEDAIGFR